MASGIYGGLTTAPLGVLHGDGGAQDAVAVWVVVGMINTDGWCGITCDCARDTGEVMDTGGPAQGVPGESGDSRRHPNHDAHAAQ